MANMKEIQTRINSVKDTMKITNAMYMISSSKMKQARTKLDQTEPYFYAMQGEISRILRHVPELDNKYFDKRDQIPKEERKIGTFVVTADKGMAGAYNHNIIKLSEELLKEPGHHKLFVAGELGRHYFEKHHVSISTHFQYTIQKPTMNRARHITGKLLERFISGDLDEVYMIYTRMENSMSAVAEKIKLLPLETHAFDVAKLPITVRQESLDLYPSAADVMNSIVPNYIIGMVYGGLVESFCSEQNARMMAMQSATDSAKDIIKDLSIAYNRARQAAITQELTEVISGANAQKNKRK
ncbi:MAG: ATP synthase F1 subunit gamma [Lachnospiraceae bacterium]|nr:ATP synthase F1 subunit gamma [Lachnospiraceae bacterium]MDD3615089.1 ATP synthase F1 subunit gamma [Lachnospiraceae bacterium]